MSVHFHQHIDPRIDTGHDLIVVSLLGSVLDRIPVTDDEAFKTEIILQDIDIFLVFMHLHAIERRMADHDRFDSRIDHGLVYS